MIPSNTESVYYLINELCESLWRAEKHPYEKIDPLILRHFKSKSFEILLNKSIKRKVPKRPIRNPIRDLEAHLFEFKISERKDCHSRKRSKQFEDHLHVILANRNLFESDFGKNLLRFLLTLENSSKNDIEIDLEAPHLLIPGPFTLYSRDSNSNAYYPRNRLFPFSVQVPEKFSKVKPLFDYDNPYLPRYLFHGGAEKLEQVEKRYGIGRSLQNFGKGDESGNENNNGNDYQVTWNSTLNINRYACRFFNNSIENERTENRKILLKEKVRVNHQVATSSQISLEYNNKQLTPKVKPEVKDNVNKILNWNWESLGNSEVDIHKPFSSEADICNYLEKLYSDSVGVDFSANIVPLKRLVLDLKALVMGIQSDSFYFNVDRMEFNVISHLTVEGVSPAVLNTFATEFLDCGTCFKRLQFLTTKRNAANYQNGFIIKALCGAIEEYLAKFRHFVILVADETLLEFYQRMRTMMKQISFISCTLGIHPDVEDTARIPTGSQFLGYLYKEISYISQKDIMILLVFILRRCCHVYFKHLQKWIFHGVLEDPCNELFICFVDHYRKQTKYYYDKAYFIRKEAVPGFFQGFENDVLQCGKYTMLLKAYKSNHPVFGIESPSIAVCLTFEEVEAVKEKCRQYIKRTKDICGEPVTFKDIFEIRHKEKKEFLRMVSEKSRKNMESWIAEQSERAARIKIAKKKQLDEIQAHLQEVRDRKLAEKKSNLEYELKLLKEMKEIEDKRMLAENAEIKKRIEAYQELYSLVEKRKTKVPKIRVEDKPSITNSVSDRGRDSPPCTETDFESCIGEEDLESLYEECLSVDNPMMTSRSEISNLMQLINEEQINEEKEEVYTGRSGSIPDGIDAYSTVNNNDENTFINLKKSASDYFNSNDIADNEKESNVLSELEQNRNRILGCSLDNIFSTKYTQLKVNLKQPTEMTDAQRIKMKVLTQEFGFDNLKMNELSDVNSNTLTGEHGTSVKTSDVKKVTISECERNRQRMMNTDTFGEFNKPIFRKPLELDLNTDRAKNRKKVLESEFHILTGEKVTPVSVTPMSTASDSSFTTFEDALSAINSKLTVDIDAAKNNNINLDVPTATAEETPECALNTAGILAREGFLFKREGNKEQYSQENILIGPGNYENSDRNDDDDDDGDVILKNHQVGEKSSFYKRCEEYVKSNFQCDPITPFIEFKPLKHEISPKNSEELLKKEKQISCISEITLTEFLQKSVFIPVQTQLEVMNNEIMRVFLLDIDIIGHFKSLRNYFFLMDGEFGSNICDELIGKLEKGATPHDLLNYQMLHSILDHALCSSITGNDKNAENLSFIVNDFPLKFDLHSPSVLSNLSLSYRVTWPTNLILNPETLEQYGNIFKYLIKVRRVSWVLEETYQILKEAVKKNGKDILLSPEYRRVQLIRQKFFHFVHVLKNHITSNALQASWKTFKDDLITTRSIEDIYRKHTNYIKRIRFLCMLNRRSVEFHNVIENIFKVSLKFYRNLKQKEWKRKSGQNFYIHPRYEKMLADEVEFEKLIKFTIYLGNKIVRHGYQEEIGEFINLINYNNYYVTES